MRNPPSFQYYSGFLIKKFATLQAKHDSSPDSEQKAKITEERERFFQWASNVDLSGKLTEVPLEERIDLDSQILDFKLTLERIADIVFTLNEYLDCGELPELECRLSSKVAYYLNGAGVSDGVKMERRIQKLSDDIDHLYADKMAIEFEVSRLVQLKFE